jgi:soluble lytic murein transglycosylase-like protein
MTHFRAYCLILLMLVAGAPAHAQIIKFVDKNGVVNYTNVRKAVPAGTRTEHVIPFCYACSPTSTVNFSNVPLKLDQYDAEIAEAAKLYNVDIALIRAVIHAESAFDRFAISSSGAQGLMQLMPATQERYGVINPFSARENIMGGTAYLRFLLDTFNNDTRLVTAGYNAGHGAVMRYSGVPPFQETLVYVERVKILQDRYQKATQPLS